jgi:hypothetical protein
MPAQPAHTRRERGRIAEAAEQRTLQNSSTVPFSDLS